MGWKTWSKVTATILFIIAIVTFYLNFIQPDMAALELHGLPSDTDLDSLDITEDLTFSFFLYNGGDKPAFIDSIKIVGYEEYVVDPVSSFEVDKEDSKEILIVLKAPEEELSSSIKIAVYSDNVLETSQIPFAWGEFL